eukprot:scaffold27286_cov132-Isochrysis_galbana.AAC.2
MLTKTSSKESHVGRREPGGRIWKSSKNGVGVHGVGLEQLHELVGDTRRAEVHPHQEPVVKEGHVVAKEPIRPLRVAAQRLHDQQVVQLVPLLRAMHLAELGGAPPAEGFVKMEHRHVRKVRNAGDDL